MQMNLLVVTSSFAHLLKELSQMEQLGLRAKVFDHLSSLLDGKGRPNESVESKLEQLKQ